MQSRSLRKPCEGTLVPELLVRQVDAHDCSRGPAAQLTGRTAWGGSGHKPGLARVVKFDQQLLDPETPELGCCYARVLRQREHETGARLRAQAEALLLHELNEAYGSLASAALSERRRTDYAGDSFGAA